MSNIFYKGDEFYLSYIETRSDAVKMVDELVAMLGGTPPQDKPETAIVTKSPNKFYILYGDHRNQMLHLAPQGLQALMQYFEDHIYLIGHSSNTPDGGQL